MKLAILLMIFVVAFGVTLHKLRGDRQAGQPSAAYQLQQKVLPAKNCCDRLPKN